MQAVNVFSIIRSGSETESSILVKNGKPLDLEVAGSILEHQYLLDNDRILLWLTEDSPYDEGLHIYLLDADDKIIDAIEIGAALTPGILEILSVEDKRVIFKFFKNDKTYCLLIEDDFSFKISPAEGWKYKRLFKKHCLIIKEV